MLQAARQCFVSLSFYAACAIVTASTADAQTAPTPATAASAARGTVIAGVNFEPVQNVGGSTLQINGAGIRSKAFFKIYAAALYLDQRATTPQAVFAAKGNKRLKAVFLREVDSAGFGKSTSEVMGDNLPRDRMGRCIPGIMRLGEIFAAKKKMAVGENYTIDEIVGRGTIISINDKQVAEISEPEFFDCLMHNYFGPKPADSSLKDALLGQK